MITIEMGKKKRKFKSIKEAAEASGILYMTLYIRLRAGDKPATAIKKPVRKYRKQEALEATG
jgi:hypothetical protein